MIETEPMDEPPTESPIESIEDVMSFDMRDWSSNRRDAWLYGIACGWGDGLRFVAEKHGWTRSEVERLEHLHAAWRRMRAKP